MISLLIINYRAARLAVDAIRTARASASVPLDVVIVDNSLDEAEAEALRSMGDTLVVSASNRGYAGGINDGMKVCRGERIVIANPDVLFDAGAIDRLVEALADGAISGPALFWDDAFRWHLPPGDLSTGREKVDQILAARSAEWREQWDRRRIRRRVAFWSAARARKVTMLSGAVLAVRRDAFARVGGFDERFALYFEENDFLRRAADQHLPILHVPRARCRHIYDQSAAQVAEESAARFAESEQRYLEKWNGPFAAQMLQRFARPLRAHEAVPLPGDQPIPAIPGSLIEASPLPTFATAAGCFAAGDTMVPPEILRSLRGDLYVRVVEPRGLRVLATYKINA